MTKGYFLKIISKFRVFTFKYNKCIGSICLVINASTPRSYLNTTNVSVQFNIIAKKLGKKDNLNTTNVSVQFLLYLHLSHNLLLFKYNKCIGSITAFDNTNAEIRNLNTTNVSVQSTNKSLFNRA